MESEARHGRLFTKNGRFQSNNGRGLHKMGVVLAKVDRSKDTPTQVGMPEVHPHKLEGIHPQKAATNPLRGSGPWMAQVDVDGPFATDPLRGSNPVDGTSARLDP